MVVIDFLKRVKRHVWWMFDLDRIYYKMSDEEYLKKLYKKRFHRKLDLSNPVLFSEKMQWLKLNNRRPEYTEMVDKYIAKQYVANVIGEQYVTPTIAVWNSYDEINFDELPDKFVLKCTHNSGGLIIVTDKKKINHQKAKADFERCLRKNYYLSSREWPYKDVQPRIIAEEYLENNEDGLHDYKIWCFNGEPIYIQYISGRIGKCTNEAFYNVNWEKQSFSYHNPLMEGELPRPKCLEELLCAARKLAKNQPFVRIDFYILEDETIRFGEITFYPMSGCEHWKPEHMDRILGDMIDLYFK